MSKKEKSTFDHFFKEDSKVIQDVLTSSPDQLNSETNLRPKKDNYPKFVQALKSDEDDFNTNWRKIRSFFRNGNQTKKLPEDFVLVNLAPIYTENLVGADFPVWIAGDDYNQKEPACHSLKEILMMALDEIESGDNIAPILSKNIERILHIAHNSFNDSGPQQFSTFINRVLDTFKKQMEVSGEEADTFAENLENFRKSLPTHGFLLPYSDSTSFHLLKSAMISSHRSRVNNLIKKVHQLQSKLKDLLRIEHGKGPERKNPDSLKDTLSFVDSMVKFKELSSLLPEAGTESMGTDRIHRISKVISDLEISETLLNHGGYLFVDELLADNSSIDWKNLFGNVELQVYKKGRGANAIESTFSKKISAYTKLFIAKRIAELEIVNNYQPDIHDDYFKNFDWQSFTSEELQSCPGFIMIADAFQLFSSEYSNLSTILSNNYPIKIVAVKRDNYLHELSKGSEKEALNLHTRAELSGLMLSHRNIYVSQTTSITPISQFKSFSEGLSAFAPAFFYVLNINEQIHENPYLWTSASIEGRDFPGFTFKGLLGKPWGSRFEVDNNPQPTMPWPIHHLEVINEEGDHEEMPFPFTFADFVVLNPTYHLYYLPIESSYWSDDLIPLIQYLDQPVENTIGKVPFIWMMNSALELQKVAVSWPIVVATQERQDFWRFLQENSGINNYHVTQAVQESKVEIEAKHQQEIEAIVQEYKEKIQQVKIEEAGQVMENLTSVLLSLDTSNLVSGSVPSIISTSPQHQDTAIDQNAGENETNEKTEAEAEEVENLLSIEPYIDTALCTSCNECTNMNGKMFNYNADKMAFIADPNAGTFKELVEAAELCPVEIIHPGTPLDPDEENLESLMQRAEKFN